MLLDMASELHMRRMARSYVFTHLFIPQNSYLIEFGSDTLWILLRMDTYKNLGN
jgi:hypothetical protein